MAKNKFTIEQANSILDLFRKRKLNAFLIGSIALKGYGDDIDIILLDVPDNWREIVGEVLAPHQITPNDWGGAVFESLHSRVDIFIKNPEVSGNSSHD